MRKWNVMGIVFLGIIGILIAVALLRPGDDSVAHHLDGYRRAEKLLKSDVTFWERAKDVWRTLRGEPFSLGLEYHQRRLAHEQALLRLGYLEEQTFNRSNVTRSNLVIAVDRAVIKKGTNWDFYRFRYQTNGVRVVTLKGNMPTEEEVLREIEAAKIKE